MIANDRYYRKYIPDNLSGYTIITSGFLKNAIYNITIEIQYRLIGALLKEDNVNDESFKNNHLYEPIYSREDGEMCNVLINRFNDIQSQYGNTESLTLIKYGCNFLTNITHSNRTIDIIEYLRMFLREMNEFIKFINTNIDGYASCTNKDNESILFIDLSQKSYENMDLNFPKLTNNQFINANSLLCEKVRHENRNPSIDEYLSIHIAFQLINVRGYAESPIVPWGNTGFRKIQTQASITDPGLGHITGTSTKQAFINGTNVHIEFLERGKVNDREKLEPYRLPDMRTIGKVKMVIGKDTSVSSYVGRPMFENSFDNSFIKSVHTMVASCSSIFINGLSECKIAIEKMTFMQAVKFMKAISSNVIRDHTLQVLAAAFCINYPLIDDRPETVRKNNGSPVKVTNPLKIAEMGIEITKMAHFEKVTFDGTANWYPSNPIVEQLGYENTLHLVHLAHQQGLLTYFSAGFRFQHLKDIVLSGTDGIGLGGAQILRFMDHENGNHGPFKKENIIKILDINKKAADSILGQGTQLLCRLDRMYYELSLPKKYIEIKENLYSYLKNKDEKGVKKTLDCCKNIILYRTDLAHPLLEWANRLLNNQDDCMAFDNLIKEKKESYVNELNDCVIKHDYDQLDNVLYRLKSENGTKK